MRERQPSFWIGIAAAPSLALGVVLFVIFDPRMDTSSTDGLQADVILVPDRGDALMWGAGLFLMAVGVIATIVAVSVHQSQGRRYLGRRGPGPRRRRNRRS